MINRRNHRHHLEPSGHLLQETSRVLLLLHCWRLIHNRGWLDSFFFFWPVFVYLFSLLLLRNLFFRMGLLVRRLNCDLRNLSCHFLNDSFNHLWCSVGRTGFLLSRFLLGLVDFFDFACLLFLLLFWFMRCRGLRSFHSSWCLNNWSCLHFWILGDDWLSGILIWRQLLVNLLGCSLSSSFLSSLFFLGEFFFVSQPFGFLL